MWYVLFDKKDNTWKNKYLNNMEKRREQKHWKGNTASEKETFDWG